MKAALKLFSIVYNIAVCVVRGSQAAALTRHELTVTVLIKRYSTFDYKDVQRRSLV